MSKDQSKVVTVKLSHGHIAATIILLVFVLVAGITIIDTPLSPVHIIILFPILFPIALLYIFVSWSVSINKNGITVKHLFFKRVYPYSQIMNACLRNYSGDSRQESLELIFSDRRKVKIVRTCRNYVPFKNELLRHRTIDIKYF